MKKYIIVTESTADLSHTMVEKYHIQVAPLHVEIDNADYLDGSVSINDLCNYYDKTGQVPKTAAVSPYQYQEIFEKIKIENPDAIIIHISFSSQLSTAYQNALIADDGSVPIYHVDTKNASIGQAFIIIKAAQLIENTPDIKPEELVAQIESFAALTRFSFVPETLDYLRAGGRVSNAQYLGGTLFKIRPLIEVKDGKVLSTKKYNGSKINIIRKMISDFFTEHNINTDRIFFLYVCSINNDIKTDMESHVMNLGVKEVVWLKAGAIITSHMGPGAIGISGIEKPRDRL